MRGPGSFRYALRALGRQPGYAGVIILTLALGIGANTTIFTVVNGLLVRPLPYAGQDRLVFLDETAPKIGLDALSISYPDFCDWRERNRVLEDLAAYDRLRLNMTGLGEPEQVPALGATWELFEVLGVQPALGRTFRADEDVPGGRGVVVLHDGFWQQRFGGDPGVLGRTLTLDGRPHTIIGVMPASFSFPEFARLWVPLAGDRSEEQRGNHTLAAVARLRPGVTIDAARADLNAVMAGIAQAFPRKRDVGVVVKPLREHLAGEYGMAFALMMGVVVFVLLIACANVANLVLGRTVARRKEVALRRALGASRAALLRMLLAESLVLSLAGAALGVCLGRWGRDALMATIPVEVPLWMRFDIDLNVLAFVALLAVASTLMFGLAPAFGASRADLAGSLKEGGRSTSASGGRLRSLLVVGQVALALVLLVGAGLMAKGFLNLLDVDPGFRTERILTLRFGLPEAKYPTEDGRRRFVEELLPRLSVLPGVESAGAVSNLPLGGSNWGLNYAVEGRPEPPANERPVANMRVVTPGYLGTLGIRLLQGRGFDDRDGREGTPPVIIVDESLARLQWPGQSPLGKRMRVGGAPWAVVVGVAADVRHYGLARPFRPGVYVPHRQLPNEAMTITLRTSIEPGSLADAARRQVWALDPDLPVSDARTMEEVLARSLWQQRLYAWLFAIFGAAALLLAVVGIYGVISYGVSERRRELGIRMALGASHTGIVRLVLGQGLRMSAVGIAIGLAGAFALTGLMRNLLYGVQPTDGATFAGVTAGLLLAAIVASWLPARRAARVDPIVVLRQE